MGQLLSSLFRRGDDSDFERILSDLDEQIRTAELRLSDIKMREKRATVMFLVYSILFYLLYVAAYYTYLRQSNDTMELWLVKVLPLVCMPLIIYSVNYIVTLWYRRKKTNEVEHLDNLKAKQKLKVEELKKKTAYYATRNLLERYDPSTRGPPNPTLLTPDQKQRAQHGAPFGNSRAMTTGRIQGQGGVRQRGKVAPGNGTPNDATLPAGPINDPVSPFEANQSNIRNMDTPGTTFAYSPVTPQPRTWVDRVVDAIVGEEGPTSKYALICESCHTHNGLVLPEELEDIQYFCPKCNYYNASRRKRRHHRSSQLKHEAGRGSNLDTPSPMGSSQMGSIMEGGADNATGGRGRHAHRPSLPDLRVADMSDAIEGARSRVERDAISEVGGDSGDEQSSRRVGSDNGLLSPVSAANMYYYSDTNDDLHRGAVKQQKSMENIPHHTTVAPDANDFGVEHAD
ncbi:hypothetical protein BDF19DRAFT_419498 [Syncephalis fuscata]|nr:hypothetical protein BDF19DRAFT_419498 [Syncephalis fuscata]